jgi:hypothetical protein
MTSSLIPERPLLISPTLAATIGLDEAVLLHVLSELLLQHPPLFRQQRRWAELDSETLYRALPFWSPDMIRRVQHSLQALGLLLSEAVPGKPELQLFAINQPDTGPAPRQPVTAPASPFQSASGSATLIPDNWQPDQALYQQCLQRGIPHEFVAQAVPAFVSYWRERRKTQYSWHNSFLKWVVGDWEKQRSIQGTRNLETTMQPGWQPGHEALDILEQAGINASFVEDAIPEFVLYWRERGVSSDAWNTRFIAHVRRQWQHYTHAMENDNTPRPITADFEPSPAVFDILAMANIDASFARTQIKPFILYWQDRNELHPSWNTRFLQHVKYQWGQQLQSGQARPLLEKLGDRSWAE